MNLLARYVVAQFLKWLAICLLATAGLFLVVDFFIRVEDFASHDAGVSAVATYFMLKLPRILTEVYPAAALLAVLVSLGLLSANKELLAMRACGVPNRRFAFPLLVTGTLVSLVMLAWNEIVVPPTASLSRQVKDIRIEDKQRQGHLDASSLWFQGDDGFFNIDYFDASKNVLYGMTLHDIDERFRLRRLVEIPAAVWDGSRWAPTGGTVTEFEPYGDGIPRDIEPGEIEIRDTPHEFRRKRRRSYEFDFRDLRNQVRTLESKGLDANEYRVDMYHKIAVPFSGLIAVAIGLALITRGSRRSGLGYNVGLAMVVVFFYWAMMAVTVSAGHTGNLPPLLAAWAANLTFAAAAGLLFVAGRR
jgi:lipopolysaccharide export system permease protein